MHQLQKKKKMMKLEDRGIMKMKFIKARQVAAAVMSFFFCISAVSCTDSNKKETDTQNSVTDSVSQTQATGSEITTEPVPDENNDTVDLIYDFTGLDSQKYIEMFKNAKYVLKASIRQDQVELSQVMYVDSENERLLINYKNPAYTSGMFIDNGNMYNIIQGKYCSTDISSYQSQVINGFAMYRNCGYMGSGTKELGGVSYKYDEYYDLDLEKTFMILMDSSNKLEGILDAGLFTRINELSSEFDDSAFSILDDLTEISQEEFSKIMLELNNSIMDKTEEDEENSDEIN